MDDGCIEEHHATQGNNSGIFTPFRESRYTPLILAAADVSIMGLSVAVAILLREILNLWFPISLGSRTLLGICGATLLLPVGCWMAGLYPGYGLTEVDRLRKRYSVSGAAFGLMIAFDYLAQGGQWSRGVLVIAAVLWLMTSPFSDQWVRHRLNRRRLWGMPVLVCGQSPRREAVVADLIRNRDRGYIPVAVSDWPLQTQRALGVTVSAIVIAEPEGDMSLGPILDDLPFSKVIILPDFGNPQSQWVSVREVGSHLGLEMRRNLLISSNMLVKRAMDLCLAVLLAVPALPLIVVSGFLVKLASPGPIFYYQSREGLDGRTFRLWKIRTMVVDADRQLETVIGQSADLGQEWQRRMKLRVDPRIIPGIGHFLRRWSIDELPQLWNVILGDMSISGPRPLPCYHLDALTKDTCKLRRKVRPGITGLSQISGRSSLLLEENSLLDTYYVRNWSLWLDLHIISRTIRAIVRGRGAY